MNWLQWRALLLSMRAVSRPQASNPYTNPRTQSGTTLFNPSTFTLRAQSSTQIRIISLPRDDIARINTSDSPKYIYSLEYIFSRIIHKIQDFIIRRSEKILFYYYFSNLFYLDRILMKTLLNVPKKIYIFVV